LWYSSTSGYLFIRYLYEKSVGMVGKPVRGGKSLPARRSPGILRFQPHAAVSIPTSESMNVAAAVTAGDFCNRIMIGE